MLRKPLNNRSSRLEVFCKKSTLKHFENITGKHLRQSLFFEKVHLKDCNFIKKRLQHRCFFFKICEIYFTEYLGEINKKRSKVHKQRVLLKMIYYYTTGWLLNEAFDVSLWNKTKNSLLMLKALSLSFWSQKLLIMTFFIQSDSNRVCA